MFSALVHGLAREPWSWHFTESVAFAHQRQPPLQPLLLVQVSHPSEP
jgi:hypothetical protein